MVEGDMEGEWVGVEGVNSSMDVLYWSKSKDRWSSVYCGLLYLGGVVAGSVAGVSAGVLAGECSLGRLSDSVVEWDWPWG